MIQTPSVPHIRGRTPGEGWDQGGWESFEGARVAAVMTVVEEKRGVGGGGGGGVTCIPSVLRSLRGDGTREGGIAITQEAFSLETQLVCS